MPIVRLQQTRSVSCRKNSDSSWKRTEGTKGKVGCIYTVYGVLFLANQDNNNNNNNNNTTTTTNHNNSYYFLAYYYLKQIKIIVEKRTKDDRYMIMSIIKITMIEQHRLLWLLCYTRLTFRNCRYVTHAIKQTSARARFHTISGVVVRQKGWWSEFSSLKTYSPIYMYSLPD